VAIGASDEKCASGGALDDEGTEFALGRKVVAPHCGSGTAFLPVVGQTDLFVGRENPVGSLCAAELNAVLAVDSVPAVSSKVGGGRARADNSLSQGLKSLKRIMHLLRNAMPSRTALGKQVVHSAAGSLNVLNAVTLQSHKECLKKVVLSHQGSEAENALQFFNNENIVVQLHRSLFAGR